MHAVSEQSSEVRTAGGHDSTMYCEMTVLDTDHGITQLSILSQVIQHVTRLHNTQHDDVWYHYRVDKKSKSLSIRHSLIKYLPVFKILTQPWVFNKVIAKDPITP